VTQTATEEKLPLGLKVSWATGALGVALLMNSVGGLALFYLTKIVGISGLVAGILLMISKLYDAFSDPIAGVMSDGSTSDQGRRRPYLFWGALISSISIVVIFSIPLRGDNWLTWGYVLFALILFTTGYSIFNVPYMAMPAEMTDGYHERSSIHGWRVIFAAIGSTVAGTGTGILLAYLSDGKKTPDGRALNVASDYLTIGLLYGAIILATMLLAWWGTRHARMTKRTERVLPWKVQALSFLKNTPFVIILSVKAVQLFGIASAGAATFFLLVEVLSRSTADFAFLGLPMVATSIIVTPLLVNVSKKIGKRWGYVIAAVSTGLGALSWVLAQPGDGDWTLMVRGILSGIGFSGNVLFAMSMLTDSMELDAHRTGMRREGMYTALYSFVEKFSSAAGPAIVGAALTFAGFDKTASVTPENFEAVRQATLLGVAYIPFGCAILACFLLSFYKLDEKALAQARADGLLAE